MIQTPDQFADDTRAMTIVAELLERPVEEREEVIRAMGESEPLAARVRAMLAADECTDEFLDDPPILRSRELTVPRRHGLAPGTRVANYRLERLVGSGSMGDVYEAESLSGDRVAVKIVRPGVVSRELRRRFDFETIALTRLHHANIAGLIESGEFESQEGPRPYLVMELVEGPTITEHVRALGLKGGELLALFAKVCDAVEHAHRCGVIHRDLKPANILVESATGEPKIVDFGVARELDPSATLSTLPGHHLIGSVPYMSPEQACGGVIDTRSDVYALGTVLYELIAGRPAFAAEKVPLAEAIRQVREEQPPALREIENFGRSGRDVVRVVSCAMAKRAENRYQSVGLLAADLCRIIAGTPISIVPPSLWRVAMESARRHKRRLALGAASFALLIAATVIAVVQAVKAHDLSQRSDQLVDELVRGSSTIIVELSQRLSREGHPLSARKAALESAQTYLLSVQSRSGQEPRVIEQLAATYYELGMVVGGTTTGSLGQTEAGVELLKQARSLYEQVLSREDTDSRRIGLAKVLEQLSLAIGAPELTQRAAKELELVVGRAKSELALKVRSDARRLRMLSAVQMGDEATLRHAAEHYEADCLADPLNAQRWEELGMAQRYLGEMYAVTNGRAAASAAEKCSKSLRRTIALGGNNLNVSRHLALNELLLVRLYTGHVRAEELLSKAEAALRLSRELLGEDVSDNFRRDSHLQRLAYYARAGLDIAIAKVVAGQALGPDEIASRVAAIVREESKFLGETRPADLTPRSLENTCIDEIASSLLRLDRVANGEPAKQ
ncbi:MAG: serine/threonine-protein kinase [Phycisphaerales bacterium]